jgi:hypothetical protein
LPVIPNAENSKFFLFAIQSSSFKVIKRLNNLKIKRLQDLKKSSRRDSETIPKAFGTELTKKGLTFAKPFL